MSLFSKNKPLIPAADEAVIVAAIQKAEAKTTGEIRVFVESRCTYVDAIDRGKELFQKLEMDETERRNGVLIYLALKDHQFAILGDEAIDKAGGGKVFWEEAAAALIQHLKRNDLVKGFEECISILGSKLAEHFPYDPKVDKNELPDEIVFGL